MSEPGGVVAQGATLEQVEQVEQVEPVRSVAPGGAESVARRGRRPGVSETRAAILDAARRSFAAIGYTATTIRGVAGAAGVDASLVHHYFGSKNDLFLASLDLPVDPLSVLLPAAEGGIDGGGERLMRAFVTIWEDPATRGPLLALVRRAFEPDGREQLVGVMGRVIEPVGRTFGLDRPVERMSLVASQLVGLVLGRYLLALDPLVALTPDQLVATYGPTLQRYLEADLPLGD